MTRVVLDRSWRTKYGHFVARADSQSLEEWVRCLIQRAHLTVPNHAYHSAPSAA